MISACAKLCDFLDCHLNSNMQISKISSNIAGIENIKMSRKLKVFWLFPSFCSCFKLCLGSAEKKSKIWGKKTKLKKWPIFLDFFKNPWVVKYGGPPRGEKLVAMDQLMQKTLDEGYNLTSWKFQTEKRNSLFHLMSRYGLFVAQSGLFQLAERLP